MRSWLRACAAALGTLVVCLAAPSSFAVPVGTSEAPRSELTVAGGFAGYAVPLPDYAARLWTGRGVLGVPERLAYNDLSLTPLHLRIRGSAGRAEIVVRSRSTPLGLGSDQAYLASGDPDVPRFAGRSVQVLIRRMVSVPVSGELELHLPVALYPRPAGSQTALLEVEMLRPDGQRVRQEVELKLLPRGACYSCLIGFAGEGLLAGDALGLPQQMGSASSAGYNQIHRLISVAAEDLGPDFRILRHFLFILVSGNDWDRLSLSVRALLADATMMGSRLVVFDRVEPLSIGETSFVPAAGLALTPVGVGEVAVTGLNLEALRAELALYLNRRLEDAYLIAGENLEQLDGTGARILGHQLALGLTQSFQWLKREDSRGADGSWLNPLWAYEYLSRMALIHPVDDPVFLWRPALPEEAILDLSGSRKDESVMWFIREVDRELRRGAASTVALPVLALTAVMLAASLAWLLARRSYASYAAMMLALAAAVSASCLAWRTWPSRAVEGVVLTCRVAGARGTAGESRSLAYFYTPVAAKLSLSLRERNAVVSRLAPLQGDEVSVSASESSLTLENLELPPLLPLAVGWSSTEPVAPLCGHQWETRDGERLLRLLPGNEPLDGIMVVAGGRVIHFSEPEPGEPIELLLPAYNPPGTSQLRWNRELADAARRDYWAHTAGTNAGRGVRALHQRAAGYLGHLAYAGILSPLVADAEHAAIICLKRGEFSFGIGKRELRLPQSEMVVYGLYP